MFIYLYYITNLELFKTHRIVTIQNVCYFVRVKIYTYTGESQLRNMKKGKLIK